MLNITKSYATVWSVEDKGNYVEGRISTSKKDKRTDEYVNSNWFPRFVGKCKDVAAGLGERDRIIITNAAIESVYVKETQKTYTNMVIFDFEMQEAKNDYTVIDEQEGLPF